MSALRCNADYKHRCDANDGEPCAFCHAYEMEVEQEAWRERQAMSPQQRDPERYEREMREAGRGHLLR